MKFEPNLGEVDIVKTDWVEYFTDPNVRLGAHCNWPTTPDISEDEEEPVFPSCVESNRPVRIISNEEMIQFAHLDPNLDSLQGKIRIISDEEMAEFRKRRFW